MILSIVLFLIGLQLDMGPFYFALVVATFMLRSAEVFIRLNKRYE